jgi:uncharacterized protein YbjT (DUF2867 family)
MGKIVVIGGTGLIGSKTIALLAMHGHEAIRASPSSGVNAITGEGLAEALDGADSVIDVSNSPSFADGDVLDFFVTSTTRLIAAAKTAGIRHYVALSVVGANRLPESGYMRAKLAQEKLILASGLPYSLVQTTQFFEFITGIAAASTVDGVVRLPRAPVQPIAADDVATAIARTATESPLNGTAEMAGPEMLRLEDFVRTGLMFRNDERSVVADSDARYFGALLDEHTLLPSEGATISATRLVDWLADNY